MGHVGAVLLTDLHPKAVQHAKRISRLSYGSNYIVKDICVAGLTQVSKERQVAFDQLPQSASGRIRTDKNTRRLQSLAQVRCNPCTAAQIRSMGPDVRCGTMQQSVPCMVHLASLRVHDDGKI